MECPKCGGQVIYDLFDDEILYWCGWCGRQVIPPKEDEEDEECNSPKESQQFTFPFLN
jgi:hypothetical protein